MKSKDLRVGRDYYAILNHFKGWIEGVAVEEVINSSQVLVRYHNSDDRVIMNSSFLFETYQEAESSV